MKKHIVLCMAMIAMAMPNTKASKATDITLVASLCGAGVCGITLAASTIVQLVHQHQKRQNKSLQHKTNQNKALKGNIIKRLQTLHKEDKTAFYTLLVQALSGLGLSVCGITAIIAGIVKLKEVKKNNIKNRNDDNNIETEEEEEEDQDGSETVETTGTKQKCTNRTDCSCKTCKEISEIPEKKDDNMFFCIDTACDCDGFPTELQMVEHVVKKHKEIAYTLTKRQLKLYRNVHGELPV